MPADRGRPSRRNDASDIRNASRVMTPAWAKSDSVSPVDAPVATLPEGALYPAFFEQDAHPQRRTKLGGRRKPENHIPRPPNAFILFRSSFIKSRHVSSEVETNHSTLSKIIGLTWQNLPEEERQKWHAEAKIAQDEHKRQFPQYSFRPIHNKARGAASERRRLREVGPKDQKRCAKIAELLVCGKKGHELEEAIHEFDKYHVPEIVTRFETPMTATTYTSSQSDRGSVSPASPRVSSSPRWARKISNESDAPPSPKPQVVSTPPQESIPLMAPIHSLRKTHSFDTLPEAPSFDLNLFAFTVTQPSPSPFTEDQFPRDTTGTSIHAFETPTLQDPSNLCPTVQYPPRLDDLWPRHGSPLSTSTSSMPSTPSQMCVPFPESYNPNTFQVNDTDYGAMTGGSYCDFSQYPSFAQVPEQGYGVGAKDSGLDRPFSDMISGQLQINQDLDFSSFMHMASGYSL